MRAQPPLELTYNGPIAAIVWAVLIHVGVVGYLLVCIIPCRLYNLHKAGVDTLSKTAKTGCLKSLTMNY